MTNQRQFTRQRKTLDPCPRCFLHRTLCICALIPILELKTRVTLVIHAKELKRTTNTGRLALQALTNSQMLVRGQGVEPVNLSLILSDDFDSYVLFPSDEALEIESLQPQKPVQLIVPDGNWRQASKINTRHPEIKHLPRVKMSEPNKAFHHLRKEHLSEGHSTLEAIALALGALEGEAVGDRLMALYQAKLKATLQGRGVPITEL